MEAKKKLLTYAGLKALEDELENLKVVNSLEGKISNESPVGQALMGKQIGDVVTVETQAGVMEYKVLDISRSL